MVLGAKLYRGTGEEVNQRKSLTYSRRRGNESRGRLRLNRLAGFKGF